ncbi:MAG TPA: thioredoxin domain-containing protein [Candidatus Acidoferrales bacterium]|nr:thioredoxin domain-containing protein [Candidatus Acidoferrales bacterium]
MKGPSRSTAVGLFLGLSSLVLFPAAGWSQSQSTDQQLKTLQNEIEQLKQSQDAMQKDITAIKNRLIPPPPPPFKGADVPLAGDAAMGSSDAKVTLVEFSDYQCPFCGRNFQATFPQILKNYVDTGKVRYVLHDFPLTQLHPNAFNAAVAARCAGEQGKYWQMHDALFSHQTALDAKNLPDYAKQVGLDADKFQACLANGAEANNVRADMAAGNKLGVTGTPGFFLGPTDPKDPSILKATKMISGAQPYAVFQQAIDALLAPTKAEATAKDKPSQ